MRAPGPGFSWASTMGLRAETKSGPRLAFPTGHSTASTPSPSSKADSRNDFHGRAQSGIPVAALENSISGVTSAWSCFEENPTLPLDMAHGNNQWRCAGSAFEPETVSAAGRPGATEHVRGRCRDSSAATNAGVARNGLGTFFTPAHGEMMPRARPSAPNNRCLRYSRCCSCRSPGQAVPRCAAGQHDFQPASVPRVANVARRCPRPIWSRGCRRSDRSPRPEAQPGTAGSWPIGHTCADRHTQPPHRPFHGEVHRSTRAGPCSCVGPGLDNDFARLRPRAHHTARCWPPWGTMATPPSVTGAKKPGKTSSWSGRTHAGRHAGRNKPALFLEIETSHVGPGFR